MIKKPQDEWGLIINHQAELNRKREQEEKLKSLQDKDRYRQDLEQQAFLLQKKKEEEQKQRDLEAKQIRLQARTFQSEEERKKQYDLTLQKSLAEEYTNQSISVKNRQIYEQQIKLKQEQDLIRHNQALLEEEKFRKLQQREQLHSEKLEMLQARSTLQRRKEEEVNNQKLIDLELIKQRKEQEEKKERDYRDYFDRVNKQQVKKQQIYAQKVGSVLAEKDFQLDSWVSKSVDQYQRMVEDKLQQEKKIKQASLRSVNETLKYQLEEKNRSEFMKAEEKRKMSDEVQRKIEENKRIEEEKMRNKKALQAEYFSHLNNQSSDASEMKASVFKMSDAEKKMNKQYSVETGIGKNNLSLGAQEILKQTSFKPKQNYRAFANLAIQIEEKSKNTLSSPAIRRPFENILSPSDGYRG